MILLYSRTVVAPALEQEGPVVWGLLIFDKKNIP